MVIGGTGSGCSSLLIAPSLAGMRFLRSTLEWFANDHDFFRQGGASVFQITMHKNLNAYHRIEGVPNHASIHVQLEKEPSCVIFASLVLIFLYPFRLVE